MVNLFDIVVIQQRFNVMVPIRQRFPERKETMQVLGTVVFLVFGWSLRGFFFILPSFLLNHDLPTILGIFSYMMGFALFESLLILSGLILGSVVLPQKWFKEGFAYKGSLTIFVAALATVKVQGFLTDQLPSRRLLYQGLLLTVLIIVLSILLVHFIQPLRKIMLEIVDRMQIFVYLYVTLGFVGIAIVILRVIW